MGNRYLIGMNDQVANVAFLNGSKVRSVLTFILFVMINGAVTPVLFLFGRVD